MVLFFDIKARFFLRLQLRGYKAHDIVRTFDEIDAKNILRYGYVSERSLVTMRETMESLLELRPALQTRGPGNSCPIVSPCLSQAPILLPGAKQLLAWCHKHYRLALLTRGSLSLQSVKVATHGLGGYFDVVRVVPHKDRKCSRTFSVCTNANRSRRFPWATHPGSTFFPPWTRA